MGEAIEHVPGRVTYLVCVDDSEDCRVALRFASLRAHNTDGHVVLLYVIEPADFQHWMAVGKVMEEEKRQEAEQIVQTLAAEVYDYAGVRPILFVREGRKGDELLKLIDEEPSIDVMVLGAAPEGKGSNELVRMLTGELTKRLKIPLVIVPGDLTDEQLVQLT
ncbi:MAG: universal stress protein [Alphaproteobacteria bacterium]|jgi:nucleotide-binding universal stress UspA family protein|nr:universal stress protein [Alphaproteobacteria bacterium]MDP6515872.1 universal stress protein [Alphaproteobacteria bacterium]